MRGERFDDLGDGLRESLIEESITLIEDESIDVANINTGMGIGHKIGQTARSGNQDVATVAAHIVDHHGLSSSTDGSLAGDSGALSQLDGILVDLERQLAGGRDDNAANIDLAAPERRRGGDEPLQGREEESNGLSGSSLGLGEDIVAGKCGGNGFALDLGHVRITHLFGDDFDNAGVDHVLVGETLERRNLVGGVRIELVRKIFSNGTVASLLLAVGVLVVCSPCVLLVLAQKRADGEVALLECSASVLLKDGDAICEDGCGRRCNPEGEKASGAADRSEHPEDVEERKERPGGGNWSVMRWRRRRRKRVEVER